MVWTVRSIVWRVHILIPCSSWCHLVTVGNLALTKRQAQHLQYPSPRAQLRGSVPMICEHLLQGTCLHFPTQLRAQVSWWSHHLARVHVMRRVCPDRPQDQRLEVNHRASDLHCLASRAQWCCSHLLLTTWPWLPTLACQLFRSQWEQTHADSC